MKCEKCGYSDNGTGDWAHVCGPVKIKESGMNERIQELAYEAEDYADGIVDQGGEFHEAYTQKLAELIVRECMSIVSKSGNSKAEILNDLEEFIWSTK